MNANEESKVSRGQIDVDGDRDRMGTDQNGESNDNTNIQPNLMADQQRAADASGSSGEDQSQDVDM